MPTDPLTALVSATVPPDEIRLAAEQLILRIATDYEPFVERAPLLLVEIPVDPVAEGMDAFKARLSTIRKNSNEVTRVLSELIAEKRTAQARARSAKIAYEEKLQLTLAADEEVRKVNGQQQKMAVAREQLQREARMVAYCEQIYTRVLGYYEAVKLIADQLAETKRDMMSQLAVIKQQIQLGEVDPSVFPAERRGVGIPNSRQAEIEAEVAASLPVSEGEIEI